MLVTGGAGFIGSAIARALVERGDEVVVLDDLSSGDADVVPNGAQLIVGDIRDPGSVSQACRGVEAVFHQAALRSVPRSMDEPVVVHEVNATGTLVLLEGARAAGVQRFVYASSSSVYGGATEGRSKEDLPPDPLSPYAVSKLTGEYYCRVYSILGWVPTISLRYFNVFGPGQRADSLYSAVFPSFISSLKRGIAPTIHWDGEQSRDFTYIDDVVSANLQALSVSSPGGAIVNTAGGRPRTINEVFATISKILDAHIGPVRAPKRPGDIRKSYADTSRAFHLLGWQPTTTWEEAVKSTVEWFIQQEKK